MRIFEGTEWALGVARKPAIKRDHIENNGRTDLEAGDAMSPPPATIGKASRGNSEVRGSGSKAKARREGQ